MIDTSDKYLYICSASEKAGEAKVGEVASYSQIGEEAASNHKTGP